MFLHIGSLVLYFPVHLLVLPIDFCVAIIARNILRPSPPVFICGTPRSGSTLLHRLLIDSSSDLFGITHFEWRYPSFLLQLILTLAGIKQWRSKSNYWQDSPVQDTVAKMHPNTLGDYEEDAILFEERVGYHPYQFLHAPVSSLNSRLAFSSLPQSSSPFCLRKRLVRLYWITLCGLYPLKYPSKVFVSKEVASNDKLEDLYRQFPGSRFIVITRSPSGYLSSLRPLLELSTLTKTLSDSHIRDCHWWPSWYNWLAQQAAFVTNFYLNHADQEPCRVLHVRFEDLMEAPRLQLNRIYSFIGLKDTIRLESVIADFEASQARRKRGYDYRPVYFEPADFSSYENLFYSLD